KRSCLVHWCNCGVWPRGAQQRRRSGCNMKPDSSMKQMLACFASPFFYPPPLVATPPLGRLGIALLGHTLRPLRREMQTAQDAAEMAQVVGDAKLTLDHLRHAGTGPGVSHKPGRLGAAEHDLHQFRLLLIVEFGCWPGMRLGGQALLAAFAGLLPPPPHGTFVGADHFGDLGGRKALFFHELDCVPAAYLQVVSTSVGTHDGLSLLNWVD